MEHNGDVPHGPNRARNPRESLLTLFLALLFGGGFLLFLILVSGGFFFYVLCVVAVIAALGVVHYVLWGHGMQQEVAAEREAAEARDRHEAETELRRDQFGIRRF